MHIVIERIAREAGELALGHFRRLSSLDIEAKGHLDLVTQADREVETLVTERLRAAFPGDGIYGEEGASIPTRTGRIWVVDPIDGTFNFVRGGDQWAVSIGLYANGRPALGVIHAPARQETMIGGDGLGAQLNGVRLAARGGRQPAHGAVAVGFHPTIPTAIRLEILRRLIDELRLSFRCCGSATASLMELARGQVDGYVACGDSTWDVMAALPILAQLGIGSSIDWTTTPLAAKLNYACGAADFLAAAAPLLADLAPWVVPQGP
jgi:myo-inositol-1(or 4)-monophosphatase